MNINTLSYALKRTLDTSNESTLSIKWMKQRNAEEILSLTELHIFKDFYHLIGQLETDDWDIILKRSLPDFNVLLWIKIKDEFIKFKECEINKEFQILNNYRGAALIGNVLVNSSKK
ncbi:MAG: hypothetical protein INQ03_08345 [Candidatus Heimdallarchaeota archaeon]|nr:hypothetical protein [Candidatus Heimdallarchaeota archaeon]